jgi:hypothetical protein
MSDIRKITLRGTFDNLEVEVHANDLIDLESAYISLMTVIDKLEEIRTKIQLLRSVSMVSEKAAGFWDDSNTSKKITGVKDTLSAVLLSLLDSYPDCKKVTEIAEEVGVAHSSISRYISGEYGGHPEYFEKCNGDWKLSEAGVSCIAKWLDEK